MLQYKMAGDDRGMGLLLIHPLGADSDFWDDCVAQWRGQMSCLAVTLRPSIEVDGQPDPVPIGRHVEDLEELREGLGFERVVPIGCAIGSMIAAAYAATHAERAVALVLSNATARSIPAARQMLTERAATVRKHGMDAILPQACDRGFLEQPRDERYRRYYEAFAAQPAEDYAMAALASASYDVGEQLKTIACPTLVVAGGHDVLLPLSLSEEVAGLVPYARLQVLSQAAHYAPYQCPDRFAAIVLDFLRHAGV